MKLRKEKVQDYYYKLYNKCCKKYRENHKVSNILVGEYCQKCTLNEVCDEFDISHEKAINYIGESNLRILK